MSTKPQRVERLGQTCYLVICTDAPDTDHLRLDHMVGHLNHVEEHWQRYVTAGPIREPGKTALVGSVFLVLADSLEDCKALMAGDPYLTCGLYGSVEYKELTNSIGQYIGGKIWESPEALLAQIKG